MSKQKKPILMHDFKTSFSLAFIIVVGLSLLTMTSLTSAIPATYDNVQVNIQTTNMQSGYFTVSAFNITGFQESSVQTYYPAASFELPNGQYIFIVTAENQTNLNYPVPLASGATSSSGASTPSTPSLPISIAPAVEYGYSMQQISNSVTLTITTQNVSSFPTNTLTIQVLYANGTTAAGASVSASTIGSSYYWGYEPNVVTWTTTDSNGYATLVTPVAPEQIEAWSWLPLNLTGIAAPQVIVAGEPVNVSGPMLPAYLGLAGSTLLVPPQTTATITLYTQQQNYWVTPYAATATPQAGSTSAPSSSSGSSAGPGAIPASVYAQQQGNPALQATQTPTPTPTSPRANSANSLIIDTLAAIVIASVAMASVLIAIRTKRRQQKQSSAP
jgi:hypothetical protein